LFGGGMEFVAPKNAKATGHIDAYDPLTGKRAWRFMTRYMNVCSLLSTGSDLLFSGDVLGEAFALDAKTGEKLWGFNTGASLTGSPITYAVNGKQYVAMPTGMGSLVGGLTEVVWPEMAGKLPEAASTLVVFALPEGVAKGGK
jgi:alcohol dehydrogenase (cytochrome c)